MRAIVLGLAILLMAACQTQNLEVGPSPETNIRVENKATPMLDSLATVAAMNAQVTLNFPSATPTPARETDQRYSLSDRPDDSTDYQVHFIYAIPIDGVDRFRDVNGEIELSANAANYWLAQQTGEANLRYDTYQGKLDVTFLQFPYAAEEIDPSNFHALIREAGFDFDNKAYIVYYDGLVELEPGQTTCGIAYKATGTLYLQAYAPEGGFITCPRPTRTENYADHLELTLLHEIFHILGAVAKCGPNQDGGGHVEDISYDLMSAGFYSDSSPQFTVLDWQNDDYFNHGKLNCLDVANSVFLEPSRINAEEPPGWPWR